MINKYRKKRDSIQLRRLGMSNLNQNYWFYYNHLMGCILFANIGIKYNDISDTCNNIPNESRRVHKVGEVFHFIGLGFTKQENGGYYVH